MKMIERSIMVAMQNNTTFAMVGSLRERHLCLSSTTATSHTAASCSWIQQDLSTACDSFVGQHPDESSPTCVADALCDAVVLDHAFDIQLLDGNRAILQRQAPAQFMQEVSPAIGNLHVLSCDEQLGFGTIPATFLLSGQGTLQSSQPFLTLSEESRIDNLVTIGQRGKALQSNVDSDLLSARMLDLRLIDLAGQHSIPLVRSLLDCQGLDFALRQSMENDWHRANLGTFQSLVAQEFESALRICDTADSTLESRIALLFGMSLASGKEIVECFAQPIGAVLQDLRMDIGKLRCRNLHVHNDRVEVELASRPEGDALVKQHIVDLFAQRELLQHPRLMYSRRIDTILEHPELHTNGAAIQFIYFADFAVSPCQVRGS